MASPALKIPLSKTCVLLGPMAPHKAKYIVESRQRCGARTVTEHALTGVTRALAPDCWIKCWLALSLVLLLPVCLVEAALDLDNNRLALLDVRYTLLAWVAPIVAYMLFKCAFFHLFTVYHVKKYGVDHDSPLVSESYRWLYVWLGFASQPSRSAVVSYWRHHWLYAIPLVLFGLYFISWKVFWYSAVIVTGAIVWPTQLFALFVWVPDVSTIIRERKTATALVYFLEWCFLLGFVSLTWLNAFGLIVDSWFTTVTLLLGALLLTTPLACAFDRRSVKVVAVEVLPWIAFCVLLLLKWEHVQVRWTVVFVPAILALAAHLIVMPPILSLFGRVPDMHLPHRPNVWSNLDLTSEQLSQLRAVGQALHVFRKIAFRVEGSLVERLSSGN